MIDHAASPSKSEESENDMEMETDQDGQETAADELKEMPLSRIGTACQEPYYVENLAANDNDIDDQPRASTSPDKSVGSPIEHINLVRKENCWVDCVDNNFEEDSELEKEIEFYENNDAEGDDDLDMDKILKKCPPTEVLQNLTHMVQLSKNMTSQLEKALRRSARITTGPFPRLPGSDLTKTEVIDTKCKKLLIETEDFLGESNKNFLTFYTVMDQMDKVAAEQDSYVSSILVKTRPRDWRRSHAATVRKMDKLWSRDYSRIITRKVTGRINETIQELDEESVL